MAYLFLLIPIAFTLLQLKMNKYIFSPLVTLSCAAIALMNSPIMFIALFVSCIGDYFMAHKGSREWMYLLGIAGFFAAHVVFIAHALLRAVDPKIGLFTGAVLALWYTPYLLMRVIGKVPKLLKLPVLLYTFISIAGLACAAMTRNALYFIGIAMLLFSDTMIAETDFVGNAKTGRLIMPTYYLCHILVALSTLV